LKISALVDLSFRTSSKGMGCAKANIGITKAINPRALINLMDENMNNFLRNDNSNEKPIPWNNNTL
jgi:hypothetical protein